MQDMLNMQHHRKEKASVDQSPPYADTSETAKLYQQYAGKLFDYFYQHLFNLPDAEDLLLEVFLKAWEHEQPLANMLEQEQRAWLWTVARNKLIDYQVSNGTLYAFGKDAGLEALRASDGALLWHSQYKFAQIDNDIVYASESFDYINALRASDGALLWRSQLMNSDLYFAVNGVVFLHTSSYGIRALNGKTGALLWSNEHISTVLTAQNGVVYTLTKDGVATLQANTGQIVWQYKAPAIDGIWLDENNVYIDAAQDNAYVVALHLNDGKLL